jgi:hypothetical protein
VIRDGISRNEKSHMIRKKSYSEKTVKFWLRDKSNEEFFGPLVVSYGEDSAKLSSKLEI